MKRTPFPWTIAQRRQSPVVYGPDKTIVAVCGSRQNEALSPAQMERRKADAALIALTGEMMGSLMEVEHHLEEYVRITQLSKNGQPTRTLDVLKNVKAVLAKAEGWR